VQHVRRKRTILCQRAPLLDAEAMLLVDDRDREVRQLDVLLDQRVRADDDRRVRAAAHGPRQQRDADAQLGADRLDGEEVLLGERLRRRHQRALSPGLDRTQERVQRDDRLARADVALQEALHRHGLREIAVELGDRGFLVGRQLERKRGAVARHQRTGLPERRRHRALVPRAHDRELQRHELVEREPLARALGLTEIGGKVHRGDRVTPERQVELGRQRIEHVARVGTQSGAHELADARRGQRLARRVYRREVRRRARLPEVVRLDVEAAAAELAAQPHVRARLQPLGEPRLVEPRGRDRAGRVAHARGHDRQAAPRAAQPHVLDDARDRHLLAAPELCDRDLVGADS
jgi:hypothetical protein